MLKSIWSGSFTVFGVEIKCHVLDDGQRVIEAESMDGLFDAMESGEKLEPGELEALARWQKGMRP